MRTVLEIDGLFDGAKTTSDAAIVLEDGEITWVGKRSRIPKTPKGQRSTSVEAGGRFALPGFINCHAHLTFDGSADFDAEARQSEAAATLKAFRNARITVRSGVTTVRDLGANGSMVVELARQIERGGLEGPRIIASARGITITGGHGMEVGRIAAGADAVRGATREQVAVGAAVIKLFSTGGVLGEGAGPELAAYSPEETQAAVEEAHRAGIRITTHAHGAEGMRIAADAGIDSIEHATLLDQQTIRVIKEKNVALVPTFSALRRIIENGGATRARHGARAPGGHKASGGSPRRAQSWRADRDRHRRGDSVQYARALRTRARLPHRGRALAHGGARRGDERGRGRRRQSEGRTHRSRLMGGPGVRGRRSAAR